MDTEENKDQANELQSGYNDRITITTLAELEERDRDLTRNMTFNQRMEYLYRLIRITYSEEDLLELEKKFNNGRIYIKKTE